MIRAVSKEVFIPANNTAMITAVLKEKVDTIGPFSLETAIPGGLWGTAVQQLPSNTIVPRGSQTSTYHGVVSYKEKVKEVRYHCLMGTWVRVVQYLNTYQVPSVYAEIKTEETRWSKIKRFFREEKPARPQERDF